MMIEELWENVIEVRRVCCEIMATGLFFEKDVL